MCVVAVENVERWSIRILIPKSNFPSPELGTEEEINIL